MQRLFLLPSEYEGLSLAIYEAMAMQLPIVAADVGGQAELVTPETGFLVVKGDSDASEVQEYLKVLLPLILNPQLRQQVGNQARQRVVESFGLIKMADRMEEIFTKANLHKKCDPNTLCQDQINSTINFALAEEMLLMALEYLNQETVLINLWQEKRYLEHERHELTWKKRAMESSKFWKLRKSWFKLKSLLGLAQGEYL